METQAIRLLVRDELNDDVRLGLEAAHLRGDPYEVQLRAR
jgi:hypothetical protein